MSGLEINNVGEALQIARFIRDTDMRMRLMGVYKSTFSKQYFDLVNEKKFNEEILKGLQAVNAVLKLPGMPNIYYAELPVLGVHPSQHPEALLGIITPTARPGVVGLVNYDPSAQFSVLELINNEPRFQPLV